MSHYAKVQNSIVTQVIVAEAQFFNTFVDTSPGEWIQTSYNTRGGVHYDQAGKPSSDQSKSLRKNFAGIGYSYDRERDAFIPPAPFPSWVLDENKCIWESPVAMPKDGKEYLWDESTKKWTGVE